MTTQQVNALPAGAEVVKPGPNVLAHSEIYLPKFEKLIEILDEHERAHWVIDEIDMRVYTEQWKNGKISEEEKSFIKMILRLFTQADTDVCSAYVQKLLPVYKNPDCRFMLLSFASREITHVRGYRQLNATLGYDSEEFMSEFLSYKEMKDKHEFMVEDQDRSTPSGRISYLAKQILMEGVNLFASFAMLLSFSQEGKLPGMVDVNKWSIADESYHVKGLTELFKLEIGENPKIVNNEFKASIYETARQVVALEDMFIDLCYSVGKTTAVTADQVKAYIRYVCDYRMKQLGFKPQFGIKENPIEWIDLITGNTFGNFFETTVVQYSKASLTGDWKY